MRIYLDVSCLNRPFDDQHQARIRLEAEAIAVIFEAFDRGDLVHVASDMSEIEIDAIKDLVRRRRVLGLLPDTSHRIALSASIFRRAEEVASFGFSAPDAVHLAAAEAAKAEFMLTCDDRLLRRAKVVLQELAITVRNPVDFLKDKDHETNT